MTTKYIWTTTDYLTVSKNIQISSLNIVKNSSKLNKLTKFPTELFNPYRFLILNYLYRVGFQSFTQLKDSTGVASDGNLASHLRYLEKEGLITVTKSFAGKYPKRFYELTEKGNATVGSLATGLGDFLSCLNEHEL